MDDKGCEASVSHRDDVCGFLVHDLDLSGKFVHESLPRCLNVSGLCLQRDASKGVPLRDFEHGPSRGLYDML